MKACFLAPTEPRYPRQAYRALAEVIYKQKLGKPFPFVEGKPHQFPDFGILVKNCRQIWLALQLRYKPITLRYLVK